MANELVALGGAFLIAGLLARIGRGVGLPTIPFFIAAGILTGPHTPGLVLVENPADLRVFAAVGLILLLFHLGLEFSLADLVSGGHKLVWTGTMYIVLNVGSGLVLGLALGWGLREAFVIAGVVGISSSAIVTKLLVEFRRLANPETKLILGIIVVEDIFLAIYLAALQPALGGSEGAAEAFALFGRAFAFLLVLAFIARFAGAWVGRLIHSNDDELLTVLFLGLAVLVAGTAEELGVSEAIGAFMVGLILAETALRPRIEKLVLPLRDAFGAVFFFAFGLTIDPGEIGSVAGAVMGAVLLSIVMNILAGIIAARSHGFSRRQAANVGLTVLGRGEFSLILATLAVAAGLDPRIGPFVALYVLALAVISPLLASRSSSLAKWLPVGLFPHGSSSQDLNTGMHAASAHAKVDTTLRSPERARRLRTARLRLADYLLKVAEGTFGRLLLPTACLGAVVLYGVAGYMVFGYGLADAIAITWSDLTPAHFARTARSTGVVYFAATVTILGLVSMSAVVIAAVTVAMEGGFNFSTRRRRMDERIKRLRDHYIICAYGRVGRAAARGLEEEGVPYVVIDSKQEVEPQMRRDGALYLIADSTSEPILRQAGIERAKGLICAVDSDATNVYITLTARSLNPDIYIVARASGPDSPQRLRRAGANRVISPYTTSGRQMAQLAVHPRVVDSLEVLGRRLEELAIEHDSPLVGLTVEEACGGAVPLLIHRQGGETLTHPRPDDTVKPGDRILAWGEAADFLAAESPS